MTPSLQVPPFLRYGKEWKYASYIKTPAGLHCDSDSPNSLDKIRNETLKTSLSLLTNGTTSSICPLCIKVINVHTAEADMSLKK